MVRRRRARHPRSQGRPGAPHGAEPSQLPRPDCPFGGARACPRRPPPFELRGGMAPDHLPYRLLRDEPSFRRPGRPRAAAGGRTRLIALGIAVWSAATVASGLAQGTGSMIAARALVGRRRGQLRDPRADPHRRHGPAGAEEPLDGDLLLGHPGRLGARVPGRRRDLQRATGGARRSSSPAVPGLAVALLCLLIVEPPRPIVAEGSAARRLRRRLGAVSRPGARRPREPGRHARGGARALPRAALHGHRARVLRLHLRARRLRVLGARVLAPAVRRSGAGKASIVFGLVTVAGGSVGTLLGGILADRAARARVREAETAKGGALDPREMDDAVARGNVDIAALGPAIGAPLSAIAIAAGTAPQFFIGGLSCRDRPLPPRAGRSTSPCSGALPRRCGRARWPSASSRSMPWATSGRPRSSVSSPITRRCRSPCSLGPRSSPSRRSSGSGPLVHPPG